MADDAVAARWILEASSSPDASRTSRCRCQVRCWLRSQRLTLSRWTAGERATTASECSVQASCRFRVGRC